MIPRKYLCDYRIDEQITPKGAIRTKAVYIGAEYVLSPAVTAKNKQILLCLSVLSVPLYISAMVPELTAARQVYVLAPFAFSALPLFMMLVAAMDLFRVNGPMSRFEADRRSSRLPACAMITALLSGGAFLALIISVIITKPDIQTGDIIFAVFSAIICVISVSAFIITRKIKPSAQKI